MDNKTPTQPSTDSVLEKLNELRSNLITLKQDRTTYVKSSDVVKLYDTLCDQIRKVQEIRGNCSSETLAQAESLVDDCFRLISLFFLTIGRNNEPPAIYAPCIIIQRLIYHLTESGNFSRRDVSLIENTLSQMRTNVDEGRSVYTPVIISILDTKLNSCTQSLIVLREGLNMISPDLEPIHEQLVSLRRSIKACEAKSKFSVSEVEGYLSQIQQIDASRVDGRFLAGDGTAPDLGQDILVTLLKRCYNVAEEALRMQGAIAPGLHALADKLRQTKSQLEKLELTQAWSLRETDLYEYQALVQSIDEQRANGLFLDSEGNAPEEGQSILLHIVRRCYAHIYSLMSLSEPVSEALTPVFNQLQTVRRCLKEVQKFGIQNARELYPYSMKLASIDNMRVDGKFMVGNDIPEGQGRVISLLAECFEICHDLRKSEDIDQ